MSYLTADAEGLLYQFDTFASELSRLPKSIEATGLELRFAMLRAMVEASLAVHSLNDNDRQPIDRDEANHGG